MSTIEQISTSPVSFQNLVKYFPGDSNLEGNFAVDHLSLNIESGELVTLLGPSGCGKTTTLRMLAGFEYPTEGNIYIGSRDVTHSPANKRDAAMVFQSYALFPHLTIYDNVAYGLHVQKIPKKELAQRVQAILKLMHLEDMANRSPNQISGGQQQRVALARAIVTEPKVLLFDEPLSNLDAKLRVYMRSELRKLQQRLSITSIYVTHDQEEAMAISDKIVIMNKGKIEQVGSPLEIYTKPNSHFVANFMGKANFVMGVIKGMTDTSLQVEVENFTLEVERDINENVEKNERVHCMIRPEFWQIDINGEIQGEIVEVTYFGSYVEYEIKIGEQSIHMEDYNHLINGIFSVKDPVRLSLKSNLIRVLPLQETTD